MSKAVSRGQALQVSARVATQVNWDELDGGHLQDKVISLTPEEFGARFTAFLKNSARVIVGEPKVIPINRSTPFNPAEFIGKGWSIWRGSLDGNGLEGEEEQDARSLAITELNLSGIQLVTTLKESETVVGGEENLRRLREASRVCLDAGIFQNFWNQKDLIPQLFKELTNGDTTYVFFKGTILRSPLGYRRVLYLYFAGGEWHWVCRWLGRGWDVRRPSAVLAS